MASAGRVLPSDVLDVFDEWRRAVGGSLAPRGASVDEAAGAAGGEPPSRRGPSLTQHLERAALRPSSSLAATRLPEPLATRADDMAREVDELRARARSARREARRAIVARLRALDEVLEEAAVDALAASGREEGRSEAVRQLSLHRSRMPAPGYESEEANDSPSVMR